MKEDNLPGSPFSDTLGIIRTPKNNKSNIDDKDAIDKCRAILSNMSTLGVYPYRQQAEKALMYLDIGVGVNNETNDIKN